MTRSLRRERRSHVSEKAKPPTEYEKFVKATRQVLSVSKEELEKREAAWLRRRKKKRRQ